MKCNVIWISHKVSPFLPTKVSIKFLLHRIQIFNSCVVAYSELPHTITTNNNPVDLTLKQEKISDSITTTTVTLQQQQQQQHQQPVILTVPQYNPAALESLSRLPSTTNPTTTTTNIRSSGREKWTDRISELIPSYFVRESPLRSAPPLREKAFVWQERNNQHKTYQIHFHFFFFFNPPTPALVVVMGSPVLVDSIWCQQEASI